MIEQVDIPWELNDDADHFAHVWADGRVDMLPVGRLCDEQPKDWAALGEVAVMGSYASGSPRSGLVAARLGRCMPDLWLCSFGDEDRGFMAIRVEEPIRALETWFHAAMPYLIKAEWRDVVLVSALGLVKDWPAESLGCVDVAIYDEPNKREKGIKLTGIDVCFWADESVFSRERLIRWAGLGRSWLLAAGDPATPAGMTWAARRSRWLAQFGMCPACTGRPEESQCPNADTTDEVVYIGEWQGTLVAVPEFARANAALIRYRSEGEGDSPDWEAVAHNDRRDPKHLTADNLPWLDCFGSPDSGWSITYYSEVEFVLDPADRSLVKGALKQHGYRVEDYDFPQQWPRKPRRRT